jgi:hypothetical protein
MGHLAHFLLGVKRSFGNRAPGDGRADLQERVVESVAARFLGTRARCRKKGKKRKGKSDDFIITSSFHLTCRMSSHQAGTPSFTVSAMSV